MKFTYGKAGTESQPLVNISENGNNDQSKEELSNGEKEGKNEFLIRMHRNDYSGRADYYITFDDKINRIDFILVYEVLLRKPLNIFQHSSSPSSEVLRQRKLDEREMKLDEWRKAFMKNLRRRGLRLELDKSKRKDRTIFYVKINCPWGLLIHYAEEINLRAPLQVRQHNETHWSDFILKKLHIHNFMAIDVPRKPLHYFTCPFRKSKLNRYIGSDDQDDFFTTTDREMILYQILEETVYGKKKRAEQGIGRLLSENAFAAAFPLHDFGYKPDVPVEEMNAELLTDRQTLYEYWARWGRWYKYQPLDHVRHYFGEKIAMYFAWIGFYTAFLLPIALIGLIVFIWGIANIDSNVPAMEICQSGNQYKMCPLYSLQKSWYLNKTCLEAKLSYLFDNQATVAFAILMSIWAVFFLEFWKRKCAMLAYHWEVRDLEDEEKYRPSFSVRANILKENPVTGYMEPYFPRKVRIQRMLTGFAILIIMLGIVIIFVVSVIIYKAICGIGMLASQNKIIHGEAGIAQTLSGAVVNLILIMLMSNIYTAVAEKLTEWEMHRTQTDFDNALTLKVFIFQFVNYYSSIFYIAFFKGNFTGYPGHYLTTFGIRNEGCGSGGCFFELAQQLFVIMVGKQTINNIQELVFPKLQAWWKRRQLNDESSNTKEEDFTKPWEHDYLALIKYEGLFDEYLEMVLQFGFITIFVAAFPLAPFFALLNNWIEIRLDAYKLVCDTRRTVAERAQNIGIWYEILDAIFHISIITNAFLIAFTSDFIPRTLYQTTIGNGTLHGYINQSLSIAPSITGLGNCRYRGYRDINGNHTFFFYKLLSIRLVFVICFEHVVFFISRVIDWSVPDVPESLLMKIKREQYLAKEARSDTIGTFVPLYNEEEEVFEDE